MINWPNFISQVFNGLALGALLALISSGLTIIYGTLGVLNLAHGAMFMLGAMLTWMGLDYFNLSYWWMLLLAPLFLRDARLSRSHHQGLQPANAEP